MNNPSEQSRHYDIICPSLITIGSAAPTAIFLLTDLPDLLPLDRKNLPSLPEWGSPIAATAGVAAFAWMMTNAKTALFEPQRNQAAEVQHKRHLAYNIFNIILVTAAALIIILVINIGAAAAQTKTGTAPRPSQQ